MTAQILLLSAIVLALIHPIVMRLTLEAAQPLRIKLVEVADELLERRNLPARHRAAIVQIVEDAFSWRVAVKVFFNVPRYAFDRLRHRELNDPFADIADGEIRLKLKHLTDLFILSSAAANPFVFCLLFIEFFAVATVLRLARVLDGAPRAYRSAAQRTVLRTEADVACAV